jgi:hypothetical protein
LHEQQQSGTDSITDRKITALLIEKVVKKCNTHCAVIDFDNRFVTAMVKMEIGEEAK